MANIDIKTENADSDQEGELDEPLPLLRVNSITVRGRGLLHDFVRVQDEDAGKRCVVDGFPNKGVMRFVGPYEGPMQGGTNVPRCVVQVENPDGEDQVLMERGLLVKMKKVKLAPDEEVISGFMQKRGQSYRTWKKRSCVLNGDGCLRYYADEAHKKLKGFIDIRRDCQDMFDDDADAMWPNGIDTACRMCIKTSMRTYYLICDSEEEAFKWKAAFGRVSLPMRRKVKAISAPPNLLNPLASSGSQDGDKKLEAGDDDTLDATSTSKAFADYIRVRRHMFIEASVNRQHKCAGCQKKLGIRVRHMKCTQCRYRFHTACVPLVHANCRPPPFGTPEAAKRVKPPTSSNIAAAIKFTSTSGSVPGIVEDLVAVVDSRGLELEGIYRVPGHRDRTKELLDRYWSDSRKKRLGIYTIKSVHDCTSALKKYLRELDEPLLTFRNYAMFANAARCEAPEEKTEILKTAIGTLPYYNYFTLKFLIDHLVRVAGAQDYTKMKFSNIAAIFAPTLMQAPQGDAANIRDVMLQMKTIDMILKLEKEAWEEAEAEVVKANIRTSASPVLGKSGNNNDGNKKAAIADSDDEILEIGGQPSAGAESPSSALVGRKFEERRSTSALASVRRSNPLYDGGGEDKVGGEEDKGQDSEEPEGFDDEGDVAQIDTAGGEEEEEEDEDEAEEDLTKIKAEDIVNGEEEDEFDVAPGFEVFSLDAGEAEMFSMQEGRRGKNPSRRVGTPP
eukprot:m.300003 g.300003  ORF g.300003 m.300003 type:complete len:730 (+) comp16418_c1_seq1:293-2482(+)